MDKPVKTSVFVIYTQDFNDIIQPFNCTKYYKQSIVQSISHTNGAQLGRMVAMQLTLGWSMKHLLGISVAEVMID